MVDLPKKKVGIVACSGEELPEGTVTRQAALRVLEGLRPGDTVTICLPLFLAGGEGDRAFARFYPTIAVDGCRLRCAALATEKYSGKPAASLVVSDIVAENGLEQPQGLRQLNEAGLGAVEATANRLAGLVDELLEKRWNRRSGEKIETEPCSDLQAEPQTATCSCKSGIPVTKALIGGQTVEIIALPAICQQLREAGKAPGKATLSELMEMVKIYNPIPAEAEAAYAAAVLEAYSAYWNKASTS
jgi:uncharacterized metal-binding protein